MNLTLNSSLSLGPLDIRKDRKHYIVEDLNSGEFYEMPEVCITAIQLIQQGVALGDIERNLIEKYPDEEVNLIDFAEQLKELNLIQEIDGVKIEVKKKGKDHGGFLWISPKIGKFFFNKFAYPIYIVLFIFDLFLLLTRPTLFPHYKDLFISNYMALNILAWTILTVFFLLIHEVGHILAIRSYNLPSKLEVGHRLFFVVLETDMSSGWKLPPKDRNVLYLSGLCFDMIILTIGLISQLIWTDSSGIFLNIMHLVVLDTFIRMAYQFFFYMKTDLYFVIENITGCYNLMESAQQLIKKLLPFQKKLKKDEVNFDGERNLVLLYTIFYFLGVILTITLYIIFFARQLFFAWKTVFPGFATGVGSYSFWDAMLFTVQNLIVLSLLLRSWRKKYRNA